MGNNNSSKADGASKSRQPLSAMVREKYPEAVARINTNVDELFSGSNADYTEVVVFTGSFFGPHLDHVMMAKGVRDARRALGQNPLVVVMPSSQVWLRSKMAKLSADQPKALFQEIIDARLELAAVGFSAAELDGIIVSDADYLNDNPMKADWDTPYKRVLAASRGKSVHYLAGSDTLANVLNVVSRTTDITNWSILVVKRGTAALDASAAEAEAKLKEVRANRALALEELVLRDLVGYSSTGMREAIAARRDEEWQAMLPVALRPIYVELVVPQRKARRQRKIGGELQDE
jgi:nicotinic acid mononucleotide adenylyltransferase